MKKTVILICAVLILLFICSACCVKNQQQTEGSEEYIMNVQVEKNHTEDEGGLLTSESEPAVAGIHIQAVSVPTYGNTTEVWIPVDEGDCSFMRAIEIECTNSAFNTMPFSVYLQDQYGNRTRGFGAGTQQESCDYYKKVTDVTEAITTNTAYFSCVWVENGFSGRLQLPYSFFKTEVDFDLSNRSATSFQYNSVNYVIIAIDQKNNPNFDLFIGNINLILPSSVLNIYNGTMGDSGILMPMNTETEFTRVENWYK